MRSQKLFKPRNAKENFVNLNLATDITWQVDEKRCYALINGKIVGAILLPNDKRAYFCISASHERIRVREQFRSHATLEGMQQAIINAYLYVDEKPNDVIVTGQIKAWNEKEWLMSDDGYNQAKCGFQKEGICASRFGAMVSHGADIAGRTDAAVYLTSPIMTANNYVARLAFWEDEVSRIALDQAPCGLHITMSN